MKNIKWLGMAMIILSLSLTGCGGGGGGDDSQSSLPTISIADAEAINTATSIDVTVTLSAAPASTVTVNYTTTDGTAVASTDYTSQTGTLEFSNTDTTKTITVALVDGRDTSTPKAFTVTLSDPTNGTINDGEATVTLLDPVHSAMFDNPKYTASWGETGVFTAASSCASCHTGTTTIMNHENKDVSSPTQWKHTTMAHALNDPFFTAVVEEEGHIFPDKKVFIEDTCMSCHAPMGYTHAHQNIELLTDDPSGLLENGGYTMTQAMNDPHSREGIACTACHQIQPDNLGDIASMSGHYKINSEAENGATAPAIFGQFHSPVGQAMQNNTQYAPQYAAHISESSMCASCHNLYTPSLDLDGNPIMIGDKIAQFPEQTPYWEWLNSQYPTDGETCQSCHMAEPAPGYTTPITTRPASAGDRPDATDQLNDKVFSEHQFVGANTYLLTLLKTYNDELGIADKTTPQGFDAKIADTRAFLATAADLDIVSTNIVGDTLTVPVKITNSAGHKLPTSYPSRRMWIHFTVTDNNGTTIFESGAVDADGRIAKDADFTEDTCLYATKAQPFDDILQGCYEPHHNTINDEAQVQIYEGVLGDINQDTTHVLLHARQYLKDNRIPPKGWTLAGQHQNPADPAMKDDAIIGNAESDTDFAPGADAAGSDGTDTVTYQVDVSSGTAPFTVEVKLNFQTIKPSFVKAMHADDEIEGDSFVRRFKAMYSETPPIVEELASDSATTP